MVRIITDSTSDISQQRGAQLGIDILPLTVNFGSESYKDGVDISIEAFYAKLAQAETLPFTSQINPNEFEEIFSRYLNAGEEMVYLGISSELSGTMQSAYLARNTLDSPDIHILDTKTTTFSLALLVEEAVKLRDAGHSAQEIASRIDALSRRTSLIACVDTLKYLKMGGRLSAASAAVGEILSIRPLISLVQGKVEAVGKARGRKAAFKSMLKLVEKEGVDEDYPVSFGHSNSPEILQECLDFFAPYVDTKNALICNIGCTIGTHAGPGAVGIGYIRRKS